MNKFNPIIIIILILFISINNASYAADPHADHHMNGVKSHLTEAGNDAFGTLQEVLQQLRDEPKTDWSKVNLESLRQHLVDMRNFTLGVDVVSQISITNGVEIILVPDTQRVAKSLDRVFAAHPAQLKRETGWTMSTVKVNGQYKIIVTGKSKADTLKIRGLGYIGVMVWGNHHKNHHWMMAKGYNPH